MIAKKNTNRRTLYSKAEEKKLMYCRLYWISANRLPRGPFIRWFQSYEQLLMGGTREVGTEFLL